MALDHFIVTVPANTITLLASNPKQLTVTNTSTSATVYFGDAALTASSYGIALAPGFSVHIGDIDANLFAFSTSAVNVSCLLKR